MKIPYPTTIHNFAKRGDKDLFLSCKSKILVESIYKTTTRISKYYQIEKR
jgi:hypothetical protein